MSRISFLDAKTANVANAFSVAAILFGFAGLAGIARAEYVLAFDLILLGVVCDMLDGYFARKHGTMSNFGKMLDNFADIFLYVLGFMAMYVSVFGITGGGFAVLAVFLVASILRLCYFFDVGLVWEGGKNYYVGMPVYFHLVLFQMLHFRADAMLVNAAILLASALMLSKIRFRKF